jgi:hypothetical protein
MLVLPPGTISHISERLERAYLRHRPALPRCFSASPVWGVAAARLVALHQEEPDLPLDPELFVAVQVRQRSESDPWSDLARASAARRYRSYVRRIVRQLRRELRAELRQAGRRLAAGAAVEEVVRERRPDLSPLGRYLFACRQDRPDLALLLRPAAAAQHEACPLYQQACRPLIPAEAYPVFHLFPGQAAAVVAAAPGMFTHAFSMN